MPSARGRSGTDRTNCDTLDSVNTYQSENRVPCVVKEPQKKPRRQDRFSTQIRHHEDKFVDFAAAMDQSCCNMYGSTCFYAR